MKKFLLTFIFGLFIGFTTNAQVYLVEDSLYSDCNYNCIGYINFALNSWTGGSNLMYELLENGGPIDTITTSSLSGEFTNLCAFSYYTINAYESGTLFDSLQFNIDSSTSNYSSNAVVQDVDCSNPTGSISISPTGVASPYSILWSTQDTTSLVTGLNPNNYWVQVVDSNGCYFSEYFSINNFALNDPMLSTQIVSIPCGALSPGSITVSSDTITFDSAYYDWTYNGVSLNQDTSFIFAPDSGVYQLSFYGLSGTTEYCATEHPLVTDSCGVVSGLVYDDANNNGVQDVGELGIPGVYVNLSDGRVSVTNALGEYQFPVGYGSFVVDAEAPINIYSCGIYFSDTSEITNPLSGMYTAIISLGNESSIGNNFGIYTGVPPCGNINGFVFDDVNNNGIQDAGELGKPGIRIDIGGIGSVYTDPSGFYSQDVPLGTYTVSMYVGNSSYYCSSSSVSNTQTFPTSPVDYTSIVDAANPIVGNVDFGCFNTPYFDTGVYSVWASYGVNAGSCFNTGMDFKTFGAIPDTCILRLEFDPLITFSSAGITPTVIGSNFVEWHFTAATVPGSFYCMPMSFCLDSSATAGDPLLWTASYTCGSSDGCVSNDSLVRIWTISSGPVKAIDELQVMDVNTSRPIMNNTITEEDTVLSYMINYQNPLPDTAYHLLIIDTLPAELDLETISRPFGTNMGANFTILDGNVLVWDMGEITLNDTASAFNGSYGFVQFNVHVKPGLSLGTEIKNEAYLYFNHGQAVSTNETVLTVDKSNGIRNNAEQLVAAIYPNPSSGLVFMQVDNMEPTIVEVVDALGRVITTTNFTYKGIIDVNNLDNGLYFVHLQNQGQKVVKPVLMK